MDCLKGVEGAMQGDGDVPPIQGMDVEGGKKKKQSEL